MVQVATERAHHTMGLHRRSSKSLHEAVELLHAGRWQGAVVRCFHLRNESPWASATLATARRPAGFDWGMWSGRRPKSLIPESMLLPDFAGSTTISAGNHHTSARHYLDVIQCVAERRPKGVFAVGGNMPVTDTGRSPDTMEVVWDYDGVSLLFPSSTRVCGRMCVGEVEFRRHAWNAADGQRQLEIISEKWHTAEMPALSPCIARKTPSATRCQKRLAARSSRGKPIRPITPAIFSMR